MSENELLRRILEFKNEVRKNARLKFIDSILITFLARNGNARNVNKVKFSFYLSFFYFVFSFFLLISFILENFIRIILSPRNKFNLDGNTAFVSFAASHINVLNKIPFDLDKDCKPNRISSRTFKEIKRKSEEYFYIDSLNNLNMILKIFSWQFSHVLKGHKDLKFLISYFGIQIDFLNFLKLIVDYFQSLRFFCWTQKLLAINLKWEKMYYGNDTCYRSYWLIDLFKSQESITIQHGIIENKILYFSISNKFYCWDDISKRLLLKNPKTLYEIVGYPKFPIIKTKTNFYSKKILIIITKIHSRETLVQIIDLYNVLKLKGLEPVIKAHPLEHIKNIKFLISHGICLLEEIEISFYENIIVINSSFAIDLMQSNIPVIPIIIDYKNALCSYCNCLELTSFINEIKRNDNNNIISFLSSKNIV